jgi:hypothetical protein
MNLEFSQFLSIIFIAVPIFDAPSFDSYAANYNSMTSPNCIVAGRCGVGRRNPKIPSFFYKSVSNE